MLPLFTIVKSNNEEQNMDKNKIYDTNQYLTSSSNDLLNIINSTAEFHVPYKPKRRSRKHRHLEVSVHNSHRKANPNKERKSVERNETSKKEEIYLSIDEQKNVCSESTVVQGNDYSKEVINKNEKECENSKESLDYEEDFNSHIKTTNQLNQYSKRKINRKQLMLENKKLSYENEQLCVALDKIETLMNDKESQLSSLYNKFTLLKQSNEEILKENTTLISEFNKLQNSCKNCSVLQKQYEECISELETQSSENKSLKVDVEMLKNVVYRLNVQLERYQEKVRQSLQTNLENKLETDFKMKETRLNTVYNKGSNKSLDIDSHNFVPKCFDRNESHNHVPISWGNVNSHTLGPLLDAYQEAITEKEEIIEKYQTEMDYFTGKLKDVLEENETLYKSLHEMEEKILKNDDSSERFKQENQLLKGQNETLLKKCEILNEKLQTTFKTFEQKVDSMSRDYDVLHNQYHKSNSELCTLQGQHKMLLESTQNQNNKEYVPISIHVDSVNEYKRQLTELKMQSESEKNQMQQQIKIYEIKHPDMEKELIELRSEKSDLQNNVKTLEKMIKKLQTKYDQTHSNILSLQISRDACRRQLQKAFTFSRELVVEQETLLSKLAEKHRENRQIHLAGSDVLSRMESLKTQLQSIQRDAIQSLDSVEQRIQQQDSSVMELKNKFDSEIERLNQLLNQKDEFITKLQTETTKPEFSQPSYLQYADRVN